MLIDKYLNQTLKRKPITGYDLYGSEVPSLIHEEMPCRFHYKQIRKIDKNGQEFLTDAIVWVRHDKDMALDDIIEFETKQYIVKGIDVKVNFKGQKELKKLFIVLIAI